MGLLRRKRTAALPAADSRDLDETRRLAIMLLSGVPDRDRLLAGTLVNALVHHQNAATADEAMTNIRALLEDPDAAAPRAWLLGHVNRINGELAS